jgi:two-component system, LytTR family, response regulator
MKKIRALIIDDETAAQKTLIGMLGNFCPQITVIGKSNNINEAADLIAQIKPDLLFLDIQMSPFESGFDLLGRTSHLTYGVIFVTAYPQYAIKAINSAQPWAYLVKPFSADDLMEAVRSAFKKILENKDHTPEKEEPQSMVISDSRKGQTIIRFKDIVCCKTYQPVVEITYLKNWQIEKAYAYQTLKQMQGQLPDIQFARTHHGVIVNLAYIERIEKNNRGCTLHLVQAIQVPVSVNKRFVKRIIFFADIAPSWVPD